MDKRRRLMLSANQLKRPEGYAIYFAGDEGFSCELQNPSGSFVRPEMTFGSKHLKLSYISNDTEDSPAIWFLVPIQIAYTYKYLTIVYKNETWQSEKPPLLQFGTYVSASARIYLYGGYNEWKTGTLTNPYYNNSTSVGGKTSITLHFSSITNADVDAVVTLPDGTKDFSKKVNRTMLVEAIYLHN